MSIRLSTAVDVLITAVSADTSEGEVAAAFLRHTRMSTTRATEVAGLVVTGQMVQVELHSQQSADTLAQALRDAGLSVTVKK